MYTEEEAKERWCQETMSSGGYYQKCDGSMCMAWRWGDDKVVQTEPDYVLVWKVGYCGLAGKP